MLPPKSKMAYDKIMSLSFVGMTMDFEYFKNRI